MKNEKQPQKITDNLPVIRGQKKVNSEFRPVHDLIDSEERFYKNLATYNERFAPCYDEDHQGED